MDVGFQIADSKMWEARDKFKELLSKKEWELEDLKNSQFIHIIKMNEFILKRLQGIQLDDYLQSMNLNYEWNQKSQKNPGIEMIICQQKHCQLVL